LPKVAEQHQAHKGSEEYIVQSIPRKKEVLTLILFEYLCRFILRICSDKKSLAICFIIGTYNYKLIYSMIILGTK